MASIKVKFRPSIVEGKKGVIYYQIIKDRVIRQLHSNHLIFSDEWDDKTCTAKTDNPDRVREIEQINEDIAEELRDLKSTVAIINRTMRYFTADDIVEKYPTYQGKFSLFKYMTGEIKSMREQGRERTAETYTTTLYSIRRFLHDKDIRIEDITPELLMDYEQTMLNTGVTKNSTSFYMRILRATYNRAIKEGIVEQTYPFRNVYTGVDDTVKFFLPQEKLKELKELDLTLYPDLELARDMFILSFYTRGTSFIDLVFLEKSCFVNDLLIYRRHKNDKKVFVKWEPCMQEIVDKYAAEPDSPYVLNLLTKPYENTRKQYKYMLYQINKDLKAIGKKLNLSFPLSMNIARHSWAHMANFKNVDVSLISEGLGQGSEELTRLYLSSLKNPEIDKANENIINNL